MNEYPASVENLIEELRRLPGIGRRGAERLAMRLVKWTPEELVRIGTAFSTLPERVEPCPECGSLIEKGGLCPWCANPRRDHATICVVEDYTQLLSIENSGAYHGVYHVLGGRLSPLADDMGENLNLAALSRRLESGAVEELVLALGADVESRATAVYLAELFRDRDIRISQLAQGLPAGANLAYTDGATIGAAFKGRTELD